MNWLQSYGIVDSDGMVDSVADSCRKLLPGQQLSAVTCRWSCGFRRRRQDHLCRRLRGCTRQVPALQSHWPPSKNTERSSQARSPLRVHDLNEARNGYSIGSFVAGVVSFDTHSQAVEEISIDYTLEASRRHQAKLKVPYGYEGKTALKCLQYFSEPRVMIDKDTLKNLLLSQSDTQISSISKIHYDVQIPYILYWAFTVFWWLQLFEWQSDAQGFRRRNTAVFNKRRKECGARKTLKLKIQSIFLVFGESRRSDEKTEKVENQISQSR